jgi:hypothetical protein
MRQRRVRRFHLFGRLLRVDRERLAKIFRIGTPISFTLAFEVSVFSVAVYFMGWIDTASVAAHAIAIQVASITFMVPLGLSQATVIRVGLAYGARDARGIALAGWVSLGAALAFMLTSAGLSVLEAAQSRVQAARSVLTIAGVGPDAAVLAVLLLGIRVFGLRRGTTLGLLVHRGTPRLRLRALLALEGLLVGVPPVLVALLGCSLLSGTAPSPAGVEAAVVVALLPAGVAWVMVLSSVNAAMQLFLPNWVRARGLAVYQIVFAGAQAAGFEVHDERGLALVDLVAALLEIALKIFAGAAVAVPVRVIELHEPRAALDEAAGEEAVVGEGRFARLRAVHVEDVLRLPGQIHQLGSAGLHAEGHFEAAGAGGDFGIADDREAMLI